MRRSVISAAVLPFVLATEIVKAVAELKIITLDYVLHAGERAYKQWQQRHDSLAELLT